MSILSETLETKAIAFRQAGITTFLFPYNPDFMALSRRLKYVFVGHVEEALDFANGKRATTTRDPE